MRSQLDPPFRNLSTMLLAIRSIISHFPPNTIFHFLLDFIMMVAQQGKHQYIMNIQFLNLGAPASTFVHLDRFQLMPTSITDM